MVKRKIAVKIRKTYKYLGPFLGVQFLIWTLSGPYLSCTDIDEIHGDHLRNINLAPSTFEELVSSIGIPNSKGVTTLGLSNIAGYPYYWINENQ